MSNEHSENAFKSNDRANGNSHRKRLWPMFMVLLLIGIGVGVWYYFYSRQFESTDDAFIEATIVPISPRVPGMLINVYVSRNQSVDQGDLLAEIDPKPYQVAVDAKRAAVRLAEARLEAAKVAAGMKETTSGASLGEAEAALDAARKSAEQARSAVAAAEAEAKRTQRDFERYEQLETTAVSRQLRDQAEAAARVAEARLRQARDQLAAANAQVNVAQNQVEAAKTAPQQVQVSQLEVQEATAALSQAQAAEDAAELDLSYTKIYAPLSGVITQKNAEPGQLVQAGQMLFSIVSNDIWVQANFKETELTHMKVGQRVVVSVDAYPKLRLDAHVDSFQPGTGARFSLLPPENATGNFVKVVQRVPVKIVFNQPPDPKFHLVPGMSVVPKVFIR